MNTTPIVLEKGRDVCFIRVLKILSLGVRIWEVVPLLGHYLWWFLSTFLTLETLFFGIVLVIIAAGFARNKPLGPWAKPSVFRP